MILDLVTLFFHNKNDHPLIPYLIKFESQIDYLLKTKINLKAVLHFEWNSILQIETSLRVSFLEHQPSNRVPRW